ncbi:hypothetical protein BJX70DRAFT_403192 [Aspergillus crustosus]
MSTLEHPLASKLPRATERPAVVADPNDFDDLTSDPDTPKTLEDYLARDVPQTSLHVVSFTDSTLISISLPHTLTDGTGGALIYRCWSLVLQGREDEIPAFHGYDSDPLATFGQTASEPYMYQPLLLTGWRKIVCIPGPYLAGLRKKAIEEIRATPGNEKGSVGDNDVITAWFTRLTVGHFPHNSTMTVRIMNAFALSAVLGNDHLPSAKALTPRPRSTPF